MFCQLLPTRNRIFHCLIYFLKIYSNLVVQPTAKRMDVSPLSGIDRLSSRSTFRGFTASPCGVIGTLIFLAVTIWMNIWIVISYSQGNYFQSSFETQASAYSYLQVPYDLKMAIVFYNKTSGTVANHTNLANLFNTKIFASNSRAINANIESAMLCNGTNSDYFSDAINPITLPDCYMFGPGKEFIYSYVNSVSNTLSSVGFFFTLDCFNPFFCKLGGSTLTSVQNNLVATFTNYSMTFYFSTRVLQPDGTSKHQVFNVTSAEFTNPSAISATFEAEVMLNNITMDYSIMPWANMKYVTNLGYYGLQRPLPKTTTTISSPMPKIAVLASSYQYLTFRYYKKEDWLLGIIGGSVFLIYLCLWILCHPINQSFFRKNAAQQLLLQTDPLSHESSPTLQTFSTPTVPYTYFFLRFIPCYYNNTINTVTSLLDIANIIKQVKIAERNVINFVGKKNMYSKEKHLNFELLPIKKTQQQEENTRIIIQQLQLQNQSQQVRQQESRQNKPQSREQQNKSSQKLLENQQSFAQENLNPFEQDVQQPRLLIQSLPALKNQKTSQYALLDKSDNIQEKKEVEQKKKEFNYFDKFKQSEEEENKKSQEDKAENQDMEFQGVQINARSSKQKEQMTKKESKVETSKVYQQIKMSKDEEQSINQTPQIIQIQSNYKEHKEKNSGQKVLSELSMKNRSKKDEIAPQDSVPIILQNYEQIEQQRNVQQIRRHQSEILGHHPDALQAVKNTQNVDELLPNYPTVMHATNKIRSYDAHMEIQKYDSEDQPSNLKPQSKCQKLLRQTLYYIRLLDFYSVKISFNADSVNHSWVGVLFTLIIIGLPCIQVANLLQLSSTYQAYVSKDFIQPQDIKYTLTTGDGFRPALCTSYSAYSDLTGYYQSVQLLFYTYSSSQGYTYYNPIAMNANSAQLLGITPQSVNGKLDTATCFMMPDNTAIPMGGINTPNQAYFGFRIVGYCSGTNAYCDSVLPITNAALFSFLNDATSTMSFYTPINQYNPNTNRLSGQTYAHTLREGTNGFSTSLSVEQTLYLDRIQLLDSYGKRFVGQKPPVIQESICTSRYQLGEVTKTLNTSVAYYQLRLRPSGNLTRVYLTGSTFDVILGLIGGIFFLCYVVFHNCGKIYNSYNVRARLAQLLYQENAYNYSSIRKFCYLFTRPLLKLMCCMNFRYKTNRMQKLDEKIKYDLNAIQMCKTAYTIAKLSTLPYKTQQQKEILMVYFKEKANYVPVKQKQASNQSQAFQCAELQEQESQGESSNRVANVDNINTSMHKVQSQLSQAEIELHLRQKNNENIDFIQPFQPFRNEKFAEKSKVAEILSWFDWFYSDAEFSLNGQWRIRSIFGSVLSMVSIALILLIFIYYLIGFAGGMDKRISYNRIMPVDQSIIPPLQLNTNNTFRAAFGFYTKPDFAFKNVSSFLINTPNSTLAMSVYQYVQSWINGLMVTTQTKYDLIPCPSNYFDGFMSTNSDPSYFSSIANGFCLPYNLNLNLTSSIYNNTQYFRISVYNKTGTGSASLQSLTSSNALGIYISVPVINLQNNAFEYKIQQIRPNSEVLTRAYNVNLTLTRQNITWTTPNYTINQNSSTLSTYNYLQDRAYQVVNSNSATSIARVYNITFSHSGLVETYEVTYFTIAELFGYLGGITIFILFVIGCIAQSFNTYYKEVLIGKELYMVCPVKENKKNKNKRNKETEKQRQKEEKSPLINRIQMDKLYKLNDVSQFDIFKAWLLSFLGKLSKSYDWNQNLARVHIIRSRIVNDLDLFNFYPRLVKVKDTINSNQQHRLSANKSIPLTSIYDKKISSSPIKFEYNKYGRHYANISAHRLSSRDQYRLTIAENLQLEKIFGKSYLDGVLLSKDGYVQFEQKDIQEQIEVNRIQKSSSKSIKSKKQKQNQVEVEVKYEQKAMVDFDTPNPPEEQQSQKRSQKKSKPRKPRKPQKSIKRSNEQREFSQNFQDQQSQLSSN